MSFDLCDSNALFRISQKTLNFGGRITVWLVSSLTRLDLTKEDNMFLFACSEAVESNLVKLETVQTGIFPPTDECSLVLKSVLYT